jgi:NADH-quinone oxidoreductase subunit A
MSSHLRFRSTTPDIPQAPNTCYAEFDLGVLAMPRLRLERGTTLDASTQPALWPLAVYFAAAVILAGAMILVSHFLGPRHRGRETGEPYESGIVSTGSAQGRQSVQYYLVATFFVIFDLEAVFIIAWAIAIRQAGWPGYIEVAIFIGILVASLAYLWRLGALDWGPRKRT